MSKISKISASHILIMHKESQSSRSELSVNEAKKIDSLHNDITNGKIKFSDAAVQHSNCSSGQTGAAWESLQRV